MREWLKQKVDKIHLLNKNNITGDNFFLWSVLKFFMTNEKVKQAAAALTYHTLFALVPIMALFVAVANIMGFDDMFRMQVQTLLVGQEGIATYLLDFADRYLINARMNYWLGAGVGLSFLIYSLFSIFQTVDEGVNSLWNLKSHGLKKQVLVFLFILLLPFVSMILIALWLSISSYFGNGLFFEVNIFVVSALLYSVLLFVAYKFIPNTKVKVKYAFYSAVVCGAMFALLQYSVSYVFAFFKNYRNIYGDLASLVLFILLIYVSWMIALAGSRWNYLQQEAKRIYEHNCFKEVSLRYKKFLYFLMIDELKAIQETCGNTAVSVRTLVETAESRYGIPMHVAMVIKDELVSKRVLKESADETICVADSYAECELWELISRLDDAGNNDSAIRMMTAKVQDCEELDLLCKKLDVAGADKKDILLLELIKEKVAER